MAGMELLVTRMSDMVFRYTWVIKKYSKMAKKQDGFDSPPIEVTINGMATKWSLSIRFWKQPNGDRVYNPVVICLNQLSCNDAANGIHNVGISYYCPSFENNTNSQIHLTFQFGVFNQEIGKVEPTSTLHNILLIQPNKELISVGFKEVNIKNRHLDPKGNVSVTLQMRICPLDEEKNTLSDDMAKMMEGLQLIGTKDTDSHLPDIFILVAQGEEFPVHHHILSCRSKVFAEMFETPSGVNGHSVQRLQLRKNFPHYINVHKLEIDDLSKECLRELIRYAYTDQVKGLETHAQALLAAAERYALPGLKTICARALSYIIKPDNVASLLLLADRCHCDGLKQAALSYCEGHAARIGKSLAWKVMEKISPELFQEACEAALGESTSGKSYTNSDKIIL